MLRQTIGVPRVRSRLLAGCAAAAITCAAHADWWVSDSTGDTSVDSAAYRAIANDGSVSIADVDQDRDPDFLVTGNTRCTGAHADLSEQRGGSLDGVPTVPQGVVAEWIDDGLGPSWSPATDAATPSAGITYAVRVGTTVGGDDVMSGQFGTPLMGNVGPFTTLTLDVSNDGYFRSVRAIDGGLLGSASADEARVDPQPVPCPMDVDGNGSIGFFELNAILSAWGPCPTPCAGDLDGNGTVGFADLFYLLAARGPCDP